jgi:hypothetical protein
MADNRVDEIAGWPSQERGENPVTRRRGSNQFLGDDTVKHGDSRRLTPATENRVLPGTLPEPEGPPISKPDAVNPLGRRSSASVIGD